MMLISDKYLKTSAGHWFNYYFWLIDHGYLAAFVRISYDLSVTLLVNSSFISCGILRNLDDFNN